MYYIHFNTKKSMYCYGLFRDFVEFFAYKKKFLITKMNS